MNNTSPYPVIDIDAHPPLVPMHIDHVGTMDAERFFERLSCAGIGMVCGTPALPNDFFEIHGAMRAVSLRNEGALRLASEDPRYCPVLSVHPDCAAHSVEALEKYAALGVKMLEVEAAWLKHCGLDPILERAQSLGMTVIVQGETIAQARELAGRFSALRLLVGGLRSKGYMPAAAHELMRECPNVGIVLSGVIWGLNYGLHEWTERLGAERLFFATGYPLCNPAAKIAAVKWELRDQPNSVRERVLNQNARRLLDGEGNITEGGISWK